MSTKQCTQTKTFFLLPVFLFQFLTFETAHCQPAVQWDRTYGDLRENRLSKLLPLPGGGFVLAGTSREPSQSETYIDFVSAGETDYLVIKCDEDGEVVWEREYGGSSSDNLTDIVATQDGGYLLVGASYSETNGNGSFNLEGESDFWVVKIDGQGDLLWDKRYGGIQKEEAPYIAALSGGGFLIGGTSESPPSPDKTMPNRGSSDIWLVATDSDGNRLWDRTYGGRGEDRLAGMLPTNDGNYLLLANSWSSRDGYVNSMGHGREDILLYKITPDGIVLWEQTYGGLDIDKVYGGVQTSDGGFMLAGQTYSPLGGAKKSPNYGSSDGWAVKLDANGGLEWERGIGGSDTDFFNGVAQLPSGNYLLLGNSRSGVSGLKTEQERGYDDFWAVEIGPQGQVLWDKTFGHNFSDAAVTLWHQGNGEFILAGTSNSESGHEKTAPNKGDDDIWVVKSKILDQLCNYPKPPEKTCHGGDVICQLDNYCSSLTTSAEADCPIGFCNGWIMSENANYHAFYAGSTDLVLNIKPSNCTNPQGALGLEAAIFRDCGSMEIVSSCWSGPGVSDFQITATGLELDSIYHFFIDGVDGCLCDYSIEVVSGLTGPSRPEVEVEPQITGCFENELLLDGNQLLTGGNVSFQWTTGDGLLLSGDESISPKVGKSGVYQLTASHTIGQCRTSVSAMTEVVGPALNADFEVNGCSNEVVLNAGKTILEQGVGFQWEFGDGAEIISGGNTLMPVVRNLGYYKLVLSEAGCQVEKVVVLPGDIEMPVAHIVPPDPFLCNGFQGVELDGTNSSQSPVFDYYWTSDKGNGVFDVFSGLQDPLVSTVHATGNYTLTVVNRETGCADSTTVQLDTFFTGALQTLIVFHNHYANYFGCGTSQITIQSFTTYESPHLVYEWTTVGGNFVSATDVAEPTIDQPGIYTVSVMDTLHLCYDGVSFLVEELEHPTELVVTASNSWTCKTENVQLDIEVISNNHPEEEYYYQWETTNGIILSNGNTKRPLIGSPGVYSVSVKGKKSGCTKETVYMVEDESIAPEITLPQNPALTCQTPTIQINLTGPAASPGHCYWWETADGDIASTPNIPSPTVVGPGTYTLTVGNLQTGCTAQEAVTVTGSNELPVAEAVPLASIECGQASISLDGSGSSSGGGFSYQWTTIGGEIISGADGLAPEVSSDGQYTLTVTALNGDCTDIAVVQVVDNRYAVETSITASICTGEVYQLGNQPYTQTGNFSQTFLTMDGCDSIVHLILTVLDVPTGDMVASICEGESFLFGNGALTVAGIYTDTLTASNGCDSIAQITLEVLEKQETALEVSICAGESYTVGTSMYNQTGNFVDVLQSVNGCDSTVYLDLKILDVLETSFSASICGDEPYLFANQSLVLEGVYFDTVTSSTGCDSVLILNLEVFENSSYHVAATLCVGETFTVGNSLYSQAGNYIDTLQNINGCDSVVYSSLEFLENSTHFAQAEICEGESYLLGNNAYFNSGVYVDTLSSANGCDSIVELDLTVLTGSTFLVVTTICEGDSVLFGNMFYSNAGTYRDTMVNSGGCDSIVVFELFVAPEIVVIDTVIMPDDGDGSGSIGIEVDGGQPPYVYSWNNGGTGAFVDGLSVGQYTVTIEDAMGCVSVFNFEVALQTAATEIAGGLLQIKILPNPSKVQLGFKISIMSSVSFELDCLVYDMLGKLQGHYPINAVKGLSEIKMPLTPASGLYFLVFVHQGKKIAVEKLVVVGN